MTVDDGTRAMTPIADDASPRMRLALESETGSNRSIECRRIVTLLGTRPGCKVHLRHPRVAPVHVAIVNDGVNMIAVDLITRYGTLLNGLKMEHEKLSDGDMVTIDPFVFRVDLEDPKRNSHADFHPFLEPTPHFLALEHMDTQRVLRSNREVCVIGRRSGCDIELQDRRVSRTHCLVFNYFGYAAVFDLLSHNQTLVNDEPVSYRPLRNDDVLTVGNTRFHVRLVGSTVGKRRRASSKPDQPSKPMPPKPVTPKPEPDMIDIEATESSQRWHIAERLEKSNRKR